jgi:hypothetical protein
MLPRCSRCPPPTLSTPPTAMCGLSSLSTPPRKGVCCYSVRNYLFVCEPTTHLCTFSLRSRCFHRTFLSFSSAFRLCFCFFFFFFFFLFLCLLFFYIQFYFFLYSSTRRLELKFVKRLNRQYEFSVDSLQVKSPPPSDYNFRVEAQLCDA